MCEQPQQLKLLMSFDNGPSLHKQTLQYKWIFSWTGNDEEAVETIAPQRARTEVCSTIQHHSNENRE